MRMTLFFHTATSPRRLTMTQSQYESLNGYNIDGFPSLNRYYIQKNYCRPSMHE